MKKLFNRIGQYQFNTLVSVSEEDIFNLIQFKIVKRLDATKNFFCKHPIVIVADPFLFNYKEELYLFYEEQINLRGKGVIKMTKTADLHTWSEPKLVLEETFHLSFPNVFICDGQVFMIPETGSNQSICLYKPNENLTQWKFYKTLLSGRRFVDSSIFQYNKMFFLFTTDYTEETNKLRLFYSESINDDWKEHPQSPIANGNNVGRCAGAIFNYREKIYRPCQVSENMYGEGLDLYEIVELSSTNYQEKRIKSLIPNSNKNYIEGGHHFNLCNWQGKQIVATDNLEMKFNFWEIIRRFKKKHNEVFREN